MESYLPEDIINLILLFLPLKCLFRFKRVSKSWYYMITRQKFIKDRIGRIDKPTCKCDIIYTARAKLEKDETVIPTSTKAKLARPLLVDFNSRTSDASEIDIHLQDYSSGNTDFEIVSSCNDRIFIHELKPNNTKFLLYNTSTGKVEHVCDYRYDEYASFGLGYDKLNNKYKVLNIHRYYSPSMTTLLFLDTNTFRRMWGWISDALHETPHRGPPDVVNNSPHWLTRAGAKVSRGIIKLDPFIAYLDASKNELMYFELPQEVGYIGDIIDLGLMSGCLSIGCNQRGKRGMKIYLMTEYGCSKSWVPIFYVTPGIFQQVKPLGFLKNGRVLLEVDQEKLLVYDLDHKSIQKTFYNQGGWSNLQICSLQICSSGYENC